ncbi:MAG: glycosyltransferase family 4 protein [Clostridia bacterium]|nr:glycosyltransferase family 4 protein [Clostridia bacterium]
MTTGFPTPNDPGKYAFVDQLACSWADMGNEVTVIYPIPAFVEFTDKKRFYKSEWKRATLDGKEVTIMCPRYFRLSDKKILWMDTKALSYGSFQKATLRTIKQLKRKPDVLYSHFIPSGRHAGDIGNKLNIPSFCAFGESSLWSIVGWNIDKVRNSLSKLSGIISVSTENKRILVENSLFRENDIEVFPNGADHSLFYKRDKQSIRRKYGFPEDAFIGVFTGAFNDDKGVLRAQEAATNAGKVKMIFIGGGAYKPEGPNILFSGKLQHECIPEYLSAADFFILPTKAEGCCNAIVEAMACGLPVISADGAYNDDILSDTYSIRTNPNDITAMAEAIRTLRDDPERRKRMSEAARKASMRFDIDDRASAIIEFMQRKTKKGYA